MPLIALSHLKSLFPEGCRVFTKEDWGLRVAQGSTKGFFEAMQDALSSVEYVVREHASDVDEDTGEPLYWSNDEGWVSLEGATFFDREAGDVGTVLIGQGALRPLSDAAAIVMNCRELPHENA